MITEKEPISSGPKPEKRGSEDGERGKAPRLHEEHQSMSKQATGNERHDTTLERRADGLEAVLYSASRGITY